MIKIDDNTMGIEKVENIRVDVLKADRARLVGKIAEIDALLAQAKAIGIKEAEK